jgi:hypothetical protein
MKAGFTNQHNNRTEEVIIGTSPADKEASSHNQSCFANHNNLMPKRLRVFFFFCFCVQLASDEEAQAFDAAAVGRAFPRGINVWKQFHDFRSRVQNNSDQRACKELSFLNAGALALQQG